MAGGFFSRGAGKGPNTNEMKWMLALFLVTALGGAVRKWVVSSGAVGNAILGIQMIIPFLMAIRSSSNSISPFQKFGILYIYFFYMALHVIHPMQLTLFHGILGMLIHGGFWLGIFFYLTNRHLFDTGRLMRIMMIIAAVEIVLAFLQYQLPPGNFLNKYAREEQSMALVGGHVRVTGTFSYLSGYTAYLIFYPLMVWAMIRLKYPQWFVVIALVLGVSVGFMTGSRSAAVIMILLGGAMLIQEYPISSLFKVAGRLIIPVGIGIAVLLVVNQQKIFNTVGLAYNNFMDRVETNRKSGEQSSRFTSDWGYIQNANFESPLFGIGLGSTYQGAQALFGTSPHVYAFGYVETEFTRILLEGGWILIVLRYLMTFILAFQLAFKGIMRWAVMFVVAVGQPIVFNPHNAAFLLLGIMLVDNIIWREGLRKWEEGKRRFEEAGAEEELVN
ncbi:MAG: hypothetical protein V4717_15550 [Bacteroidota bacterium]